jgi:hypothetical protein
MGCQPLEDLYALYLLESLAPEDSIELSGHLARGCPQCLERIREAVQTVYLLSLTARPARPHPKMKAQLLQRLRKKS